MLKIIWRCNIYLADFSHKSVKNPRKLPLLVISCKEQQ